MIIQVNQEGINALREYSIRLRESIEAIKSSCQSARNVIDEHSGKIGPHEDQIKTAINTILGAVHQGTVPAIEVSDKINEVAEAYQEIVEGNYYGGMGN